MCASNRRAEDRIDVRIPIRFRPITNPPSPEQSAESANISEHGLLFFTNCPLRVGEEVEIYLRMPRELSQKSGQVRWGGRVVHVEHDRERGRHAVGVRVETYAPVVERECWVC